MGSCNSTQIEIDMGRTSLTYSPGETISGVINVVTREANMKIKKIYVTAAGESGYATTRTFTDSKGNTRTKTEFHCVRFYDQKIDLLLPDGGQELDLQSGAYSWRFTTKLPDDLPPSLTPNRTYPHVLYYVEFVIGRSWYQSNPKQKRYFTVFPRVNLMKNPSLLTRSHVNDQNRKDVNLHVSMNQSAYLPGQNILGTVELQNPKRLQIEKVTFSLIQSYEIHSDKRHETIISMDSPTINKTKDEFIQEQLFITIPSNPLAPTYEFHNGYHKKTDVSNSYRLEFNVHVSGMFNDFRLSIPIAIANESSEE